MEQKNAFSYDMSVGYLGESKTAITVTKDYFDTPDGDPFKIGDSSYEVVPWGANNKLPSETRDSIEGNPVATSAIGTAIDILYGAGLVMGIMKDGEFKEYTKEHIVGSENLSEIQDFLDRSNIHSVMSEIVMDITWFWQSPVELIFDKNKGENRKIVSVQAKEMYFTRWSKQDDSGNVKHHLYSNKWGDNPDKKNIIATPVLDFRAPRTDLMNYKDNTRGKCVYPLRMPSVGRPYYPRPYWYSIIKSGWLDFANYIPIFKRSLLTNALAVRFHVEFNSKYFSRKFTQEGIDTAEKKKAYMEKTYKDIDTFLTGYENQGKSLRSFFYLEPGKGGAMQEVSDIKITPIEHKIGGELLTDSQEASSMTYTAFRVHPSLIGVIPGKNTNNMSGSDKRELLRIEQSMQTRTRHLIISLMESIRIFNAWPANLVFAFKDVALTTLDEGKETTEQTTT